jgi:hypothetical protein
MHLFFPRSNTHPNCFSQVAMQSVRRTT